MTEMVEHSKIQRKLCAWDDGLVSYVAYELPPSFRRFQGSLAKFLELQEWLKATEHMICLTDYDKHLIWHSYVRKQAVYAKSFLPIQCLKNAYAGLRTVDHCGDLLMPQVLMTIPWLNKNTEVLRVAHVCVCVHICMLYIYVCVYCINEFEKQKHLSCLIF